jgi:hypothetical protein
LPIAVAIKFNNTIPPDTSRLSFCWVYLSMNDRLLLISFLLFGISSAISAAEKPVDYTREIRPLFANSCYACHGPDENKREAKLRLDIREGAIEKVIVPGKSSESRLIKRITTEDEEKFMPPAHSKKTSFTKDQVALVKRWIDEGAKFDQHWAFVKPVRPEVPQVQNAAGIKNPIDAFILAPLEKKKVNPSPEADKVTLIRRLSLDLLGLPPRMEEVDAFLKDSSTNAYEKLVDKLLSSEHFGERMAIFWLDAVRYADTGGYHSDNHRDVYLYRDWVIQAFNQNMPFDRFTIEQLAGDLLPNSTKDQRIASGYNRMLMTTEEGGAQAKEYTAKYAADRVRNASSVWLGATMGCAECHNHKYDPFTTKDFYRFAAFFADVQERAVGRQDQTSLPTPEQAAQLKTVDTELTKLKAELAKPSKELDDDQIKWEDQAKKDNYKGLSKLVTDALKIEADKRSDNQKQILKNHYRTIAPQLEPVRKQIASAQTKRDALAKIIPSTLVTMATNPRMIRVLPRGNWLDDSGEIVTPAVPGFLASLETKDRATRMDLAKWFTSPDNPLVARVFVNRLWKITFGQGLVRSLEDFGTQGQLPSHPELLDWLSSEFIANNWDSKKMLKLMVMSNAYRQSSVGNKELRERDPGNLWLARQNRFRIDAEFVRDNALAVSGLLSDKIGGPSVKPYQPSGYWSYLNFPVRDWANEKGSDQYRRGLYIYWCRSFLHPSLAAFDAPNREECTVERPRSSTPLQALVLLNDPTYIEASRVFAEKILKQGKTTEERLNWAYRKAVSRTITAEEVKILAGLLQKHLQEYQADKTSAEKILGTGQSPREKEIDPVELAAWTSVARVILNLHETVTRN